MGADVPGRLDADAFEALKALLADSDGGTADSQVGADPIM
jgi:hypothetical protein